MIALPLSIALLMMGLIFLQHNHYAYVERQKTLDKSMSTAGDFEKLKKEFDEYKKRLDSVSLKVGFKL